MNVPSMTIRRSIFHGFLIVLVLGLFLSAAKAANDLPQAAGSPMAGITFDDRPLMLPVQRNFQMAMLTASSELGRSCGTMEAYGWRMGSNEQQRVNQIFNNTVDRMRAQGFSVETRAPSSVSRDVTMFTADRPDKHLLFMWSAGEIGLVMVMCETSAPAPSFSRDLAQSVAQAAPMRAPLETGASRGRNEPLQLTRTGKHYVENFSPVGEWIGSYTCMQGTTGGTLQISQVRGDQFEGVFRFYPTPKNPYVPTGRYTVYGEYDRDSQRILINPGKWLQRPKDYFNTIMIGSFDPVAKTFSGFFQGINGCTSFEAHYVGNSESSLKMSLKKGKEPVHKTKKSKAKKKKAAKLVTPAPAKKPESSVPSSPASDKASSTAPSSARDSAIAPVLSPEPDTGLELDKKSAATPSVTPPAADTKTPASKPKPAAKSSPPTPLPMP